MPRSHRQRSHRDHASSRSHRTTLELLAAWLLANAKDPIEEFCALAVARLALKERRAARSGKYGRRGAYEQVKSRDFLEIILLHASTWWFKSWLRYVVGIELSVEGLPSCYRMDRDAFWFLNDLIQDDPMFVSTGHRPQQPLWLQLAVFLCRMGNKTGVTAASFASVSEGSAFLYSERVCQAFRNIRDDHVYWPGYYEREQFSNAMSAWGFPGCLGSGDGTYIRLEKRPEDNGYAYWCRKKMYAVRHFFLIDLLSLAHRHPCRSSSRPQLTIVVASPHMTSGGQAPFKTAVSSSCRISGVTGHATSAAMSISSLTKVSAVVLPH